jgi:DNA-binding FadR family transcriptional regulator
MDLIRRVPGLRNRIARQTVREQISEKLTYMIRSGLLQPGDELPSERELALTLKVSRETVRAAIGALHDRHLIEINHGTRSRVLAPNRVDGESSARALGSLHDRSFTEVAEARAAVELPLIALAAERISDAQLSRLSTLVDEQEKLKQDPVRFQISDREFHALLYSASGNTLLADVVSDFYDYALGHRRRALERRDAIANSVVQHREIVRALSNRDPDAAASAMRSHLDHVRRSTLREMQRRHR